MTFNLRFDEFTHYAVNSHLMVLDIDGLRKSELALRIIKTPNTQSWFMSTLEYDVLFFQMKKQPDSINLSTHANLDSFFIRKKTQTYLRHQRHLNQKSVSYCGHSEQKISYPFPRWHIRYGKNETRNQALGKPKFRMKTGIFRTTKSN